MPLVSSGKFSLFDLDDISCIQLSGATVWRAIGDDVAGSRSL